MWTSTAMSPRVSTFLVRGAFRNRRSRNLEHCVPGPSQAGGAEASTCRRRALTVRSDTGAHNGHRRPARAGMDAAAGLPARRDSPRTRRPAGCRGGLALPVMP